MPKLTRRSVVLAAMAAPLVARAQGWPATIKLVVPYPPAGSTDVIARIVQNGLQQRLGTTIIIDNRGGGSGSIGTAAVAKSAPDGTTWLMVFDNHGANPFVLPNLPYDTEKDLDPVQFIGTSPYTVATNPEKPYKTLADVLTAAKQTPDKISYASVGSGSIGHLAMVLLSKQAGVKLVHVPYRGGGPAMNDALAGHVDLLVGSTALSIGQIQAGKLRAITQTGKARTAALRDIATVIENGFPGFEAYAWWGMFAPAGTPKPMIERFGNELAATIREPTIFKQLSESQQVSLDLGGPASMRAFLAAQMKQWGAVVKENNISGDAG